MYQSVFYIIEKSASKYLFRVRSLVSYSKIKKVEKRVLYKRRWYSTREMGLRFWDARNLLRSFISLFHIQLDSSKDIIYKNERDQLLPLWSYFVHVYWILTLISSIYQPLKYISGFILNPRRINKVYPC